jgi:acid phosphatase
MSLHRLLPSFALFALLAGCQPMPTRPVAAAPAAPAQTSVAAPVAGPNDGLDATLWMQSSVEYRLVAGQTWRSALTQLDRAIKTPAWDALTNEDRDAPAAGLPPAVIVDVDDTVLDVSAYAARLVKGDRSHDEALWQQWAKEETARPVPGALEFARAAAARGVTLIYITNRAPELAPATLENLRKLGFPLKDDSQLLTRASALEGCQQVGSEKTCLRRQVGRHYRVLLQIGDQLGDLLTIANNTPEGREEAVRPYLAWVGERWFVLPNPTYGSWESALYGDDRNLSPDERRARKRAALRD